MKDLITKSINDSFSINKNQYNLMLKAIGFERNKLENNTFKMMRNIFQQNKNIIDTDLINLTSLGLGRLEESKIVTNFLVSKKGVDFISMVEKCDIDYNGFFDEGWDDYC